MRQHLAAVLFAAALLAHPAAAAPDQTQGVALMSAIVKSDATLLGGVGVVAAFKPSTGDYTIRFNRSVVGCTSVVSFGSNTTAAPGMASVIVPTPGGVDVVSVLTVNTTGAKVDRSFMLIVFCAQ